MVKIYIMCFYPNNVSILDKEFFILYFVSSNRLSMTDINFRWDKIRR